MKCEKFTDDRQQTTDDGRQVMAIVHLDRPGELKTHKPRYCEKEKDNGLDKPSCGTVALYGPFFKIWRTIYE